MVWVESIKPLKAFLRDTHTLYIRCRGESVEGPWVQTKILFTVGACVFYRSYLRIYTCTVQGEYGSNYRAVTFGSWWKEK